MIDQVVAGSNFILCSGISTGLSVMDEQRMALEDKITQLQFEQTLDKVKEKRKKSKSRSKREDFKLAMQEATNKETSTLVHQKSNKSITLKKSASSIIKTPMKKDQNNLKQSFSNKSKTRVNKSSIQVNVS